MRVFAHAFKAAACAWALALPAACTRTPEQASPIRTDAPDAVYTVRGRVEMIPEPGSPTSEFQVHHEPIDDFLNPNGTRGMGSMIMPFTLSEGVSLEGIAPGDVVEMRLSQWKTGIPRLVVTRVTELSADTPLNFGVAQPKQP